MEKLDPRCAVLVTSCDNYEDAWNPFFTLFSIMWQDCPYPLFLNTETKNYAHEKLEITCLHPTRPAKKNKTISWSNRLRQAVEQIDAPYILFFLEDFFLMSEVRADVVEKCLTHMEETSDVGFVNFYSDPHTSEVVWDEFSPIDPEYDYGINTMTALWNKEYLLAILRDENPWDFEFFATRRAKKMPYRCLTHLKEFPPVFDYSIKIENGYGIYQGKWLKNNQSLFEKHGIKVDLEKRGVIDPEIVYEREHEKHWVWHCFVNTLKHPSLIGHYCSCTKKVLADKIRRFKAKHFNK